MRDILAEITKEKEELDKKRAPLSMFLGSNIFNGLPQSQQHLMVLQESAMTSYSRCLECRIIELS